MVSVIMFGTTVILAVCLAQMYPLFVNADVPELGSYAETEDAFVTIPDLIRRNSYPVEVHTVITPDGYILTMHRIRHGIKGPTGPRKVAFLQHGILASSIDWILSGPQKSLGYSLADEGYDVWMGNARGNTQSRNHTYLNPDKDAKFWDFSWHEIGYFDLPTMIDYVLAQTGEKDLFYVGHSQGTTAFYVMASMRPEYNAKIRAQISLAPIAFMNHMTSPLMRIIARWHKPIGLLADLIGMDEFLPTSKFIQMGGSAICGEDSIARALCHNVLFAVCGFSPSEMNATLLPIMIGHFPAGAATKQLMHYGQSFNSAKFARYDFGLGNVKEYGRLSPPIYALDKVTAPVYLIYSKNDWLASEVDVIRLYEKLGNARGRFLVAKESFNHLDYIMGINAHKYVYSKVISLLARHDD